MRTTLKKGIGRGAAGNGNGHAVLPPGVQKPIALYRQPPRGGRSIGRRLAGFFFWLLVLVAMVAGKAMAAVCIALPLGLIAGRWLLQIATRLVAVSATSGLPNPPLRLDVPWLSVAVLSVVLLVILAVSAIAGSLSARRVPEEDLMRGTT